jgi:hypothetical protein
MLKNDSLQFFFISVTLIFMKKLHYIIINLQSWNLKEFDSILSYSILQRVNMN